MSIRLAAELRGGDVPGQVSDSGGGFVSDPWDGRVYQLREGWAMSIQWLRTSSMVWMVLCGGLYGCAAADEGLGQRVDRLDRAATPDEVMRARALLFDRASLEELQGLKVGASTPVALYAAWQEVLVTSRHSDIPQGLAPASTARFVGFLEGRLRVRVPKWWESTLKSPIGTAKDGALKYEAPDWLSWRQRSGLRLGDATSTESRIFGSGPDAFVFPSDGEIVVPRGVQVQREKQTVRFTVGSQSFSVPVSFFKQRGWPQIDVLIDGQRAYLALENDYGNEFPLVCLDGSGRELWRTTVWCAQCKYIRGSSYVRTELIADRERIIVFGAEPYTLFVEGFAKNDGTNLFRFATYYTDEHQ